MMSRKFAQWLSKQAAIHGWGEKAEICRRTGLKPPYVTRLLNGERRGDVGINTLQGVAQALGIETWRLVWMIENDISELPPESRPTRIRRR